MNVYKEKYREREREYIEEKIINLVIGKIEEKRYFIMYLK